MLLRRFPTAAVLLGVVVLTPSLARAQNLSDLLVNLIQTDIFLAPPTPPFPSHSTHFVPGPGQQIAPYFFNQEILSQLATVPIGSSSGGFSYTFDPTGGTFQRATDSFGPTFAERALTNGKGKFTFGGNFQYSRYTSFEGTDLENGASSSTCGTNRKRLLPSSKATWSRRRSSSSSRAARRPSSAATA